MISGEVENKGNRTISARSRPAFHNKQQQRKDNPNMATPNAKIQVGIALDVEEYERMKKATRVDIASQAVLSLARLGLEQLEHARAESSPSNLVS